MHQVIEDGKCAAHGDTMTPHCHVCVGLNYSELTLDRDGWRLLAGLAAVRMERAEDAAETWHRSVKWCRERLDVKHMRDILARATVALLPFGACREWGWSDDFPERIEALVLIIRTLVRQRDDARRTAVVAVEECERLERVASAALRSENAALEDRDEWHAAAGRWQAHTSDAENKLFAVRAALREVMEAARTYLDVDNDDAAASMTATQIDERAFAAAASLRAALARLDGGKP